MFKINKNSMVKALNIGLAFATGSKVATVVKDKTQNDVMAIGAGASTCLFTNELLNIAASKAENAVRRYMIEKAEKEINEAMDDIEENIDFDNDDVEEYIHEMGF